MYKFRNIEDNDTDTQKTDLQMNWESYLSIALCINCVIFQQLNAMFGHKIASKPRILTVLAIDLVLFLTLMFFAETNTDDWQMEFLIFSLVIAGWIGANEAILQGAFYGILGKFPPDYIGAAVQGNFCKSKVFTVDYVLYVNYLCNYSI